MKTKSMFISSSMTSEGGVERVIHSGNPLEVMSQIRCLGLIIDDRLSWTHHVDSVIAKVSKKIGALKRVRRQFIVGSFPCKLGANSFSASFIPTLNTAHLSSLLPYRPARGSGCLQPTVEQYVPRLEPISMITVMSLPGSCAFCPWFNAG